MTRTNWGKTERSFSAEWLSPWYGRRARRRVSIPDHQKRPVFFFIDEAHYVIQRDTTISKIIQQCRAQKIAMVFSHQEVQQIKNEDVKSALTQLRD